MMYRCDAKGDFFHECVQFKKEEINQSLSCEDLNLETFKEICTLLFLGGGEIKQRKKI